MRFLCWSYPLSLLALITFAFLSHTSWPLPNHSCFWHLRVLNLCLGKLSPDTLSILFFLNWFTFCTTHISFKLIHIFFLGQIVHQFGIVLGILCMNLCVSLPAVVNSGLICWSQTLTVLSRPFHHFIAMGNVMYLKYGGQAFYPFPCSFCY